MEIRVCICQIIAVTLLLSGHVNAQYYYSDNRQVPIMIDSSKVVVLFDSDWSFNSDDIEENYERIDSISLGYTIDGFRIAYLGNPGNLDSFLDSLEIDIRVALVNPCYLIEPGVQLLAGRTICCKFGDNVPYTFIDSLNQFYGVDVVYEHEHSQKQFLLSVKEHNNLSTLEIANIYYALSETEFCHPNFIGGYEFDHYYIYDHYWQEQWAMHRVFSASPDSLNHRAFEITQGDSSIIIAVPDMGISPHEDLPSSRIVPGYDFERMDNDPTPCNFPNYGWHGIAVAGIIGAAHNGDSSLLGDPNTGIYGMAPKCKIMPIKIGSGIPVPDWYVPDTGFTPHCWGYFATDERIAGSVEWAWAHGADIISGSWGARIPIDVLSFALRQASIVGRAGKGCGLFFAAGNLGSDSAYYPAVMPEVISVGALHPDDSVWSYSNHLKVDVVAPTGMSNDHPIWTLDLMDTLGFNHSNEDDPCGDPNDIDYNCHFGGTSAAQPVAAGVGALLLSRRPDLTHDQLCEVIRNSADTNLYVPISQRPDHKYGYGMVHPLRALLSVVRGDANNDGTLSILDVGFMVDWLYEGGPAPQPDLLMADANCDGNANILDVGYLVNYLYHSGPLPQICFKY